MTTEITHLTEQLQSELDKIGSKVRLQTKNNSAIKLNYKDWAWADLNGRQLQASTIVGQQDKHIQLEEKGITACISTAKDISEMAIIIDKWLAKTIDIWQLAKEHQSIKISERYKSLLTLSNDKLLELRWADLSNEIEIGHIRFRKDVFKAFKQSFSNLYPFFSHDNLWFSNFIELPNDIFKSPFIFCNADTIEIGLTLGNSPESNNFKTTDINIAIKKTKELLPTDLSETINPLKNNNA